MLLVDATAFKKALEAERAKEDQHILDGKCTDFAAYRHKVGIRKGIERALELLKETMKKQGDDDDE